MRSERSAPTGLRAGCARDRSGPVAALGPEGGRGGGEIDLILRAPDGTLVFAEVRQRASTSHGGAAASVSATKQRRIIFAARHYLVRLGAPPPCRFDVVVVEPTGLQWLQGAFDAG